MTASRILLLATALLIALAACDPTSDSTKTWVGEHDFNGELTVFAASSLTNAFADIEDAFRQLHPNVDIAFNFAGTPTLRTQIELGAAADVFAAADDRQMEMAATSGLLRGDPQLFATNRLSVVAPVSDSRISVLADLATPDAKLVLAHADVPAGRYALRALALMDESSALSPGYSAAVLDNVVSYETNVRQVLAKVALGEADAGIVYHTDVSAAHTEQIRMIPIPDDLNVVAIYPIAVLEDAPNLPAADAFVAFVLSPEGQAILQDHGFGQAD